MIPGKASPTILHVDMDAFYAAVEVLEDPTLAGKPVVVGGSGRRGVVAAASYEARAYGVRSAMPSGRAKQLCPHAVFVSGRYDRYTSYSERIHAIFESYTPLVEGIALDEAFLDVAGALRLFGDGEHIAHDIRRRIGEEVGLSASVGVAATKFVAKLASEAAKPRASLAGIEPGRGVVVISPGEELSFLHPMPVEALWGVGPATAQRLRRLGVTTIGDLARVGVETLESSLGRAHGRHLHELARGRDPRPVEADRELKSVSHEETYSFDIDRRDELHREVVRMADAVAGRLRAAGVAGRTVTLKVRYGDFRTVTRSQTVPSPVDDGFVIAGVGSALLDQVDLGEGVRLLGVSVSNLIHSEARQLALDFDPGTTPGRPGPGATKALDQVRDRFGEGALGPAVLLDGGALRVKRRGDTQWGPS
jgi:DNA polymerase IV